MNIDIRKNIIDNIRNESDASLLEIINDATNSDDELVFPGLGVIFSLFWNKLEKEEKLKITNIVLKKIK